MDEDDNDWYEYEPPEPDVDYERDCPRCLFPYKGFVCPCFTRNPVTPDEGR